MKLLTASKIHRDNKCKIPFSVWITELKEIHKADNPEKKFIVWLNEKNLGMNADGKKQGNKPNLRLLTNIFSKTSDELEAIKEKSRVSGKGPKELSRPTKTILGFKPLVFYSIAGVAVIGTITAFYLIAKRR